MKEPTIQEIKRQFSDALQTIAQLTKERDQLAADKTRLMLDNASWESTCSRIEDEKNQLAAKCAEMLEFIDHKSNCAVHDEFIGPCSCGLKHALSDQCGVGWLSPEKKKAVSDLIDKLIGYGRSDMGHQQMCDYVTETAEEVKEICK